MTNLEGALRAAAEEAAKLEKEKECLLCRTDDLEDKVNALTTKLTKIRPLLCELVNILDSDQF